MSAPERIWALPGASDGWQGAYVGRFSVDGAVEYVRADLSTPTDEQVKALEAENAQLRAVIDRAGALAVQRASHAFIIEALSRYEAGLRQDSYMQDRTALRDMDMGK